MNEEFIRRIYAAIVEDNLESYKNMFSGSNNESTIDYMKAARSLYCALDESQKAIFFSMIKQVIIDTISNVFGVIDGVCGIDDKEWNCKMSINGQSTDDELSDSFLEYVEILEVRSLQ